MYEISTNDKYYMYDIYEEKIYYLGNKINFLFKLQNSFITYRNNSWWLDTSDIAMNLNDKYCHFYYHNEPPKLYNKRYIFFMNDYRIINVKDYEEEVLNFKPVYKKIKHKYKKHKHGHCNSRYNDKLKYKRTMTYQNVLDNEYKIKHRKYFKIAWDYIEQHKRVQASWKEQTKHKCQFKGDRKTIRKMK